ncbi:hypothetical protein EVAR_77650_1 [Eumeta japonica]|uniref:Uncharacterized protein n=1 Tax=Eumeta variegata TaxID=151549 RepID=A0A4C1TAD0_EUMVA|nr:hypothetical protein EVAR_77650_1 [Eumeta japonica]
MLSFISQFIIFGPCRREQTFDSEPGKNAAKRLTLDGCQRTCVLDGDERLFAVALKYKKIEPVRGVSRYVINSSRYRECKCICAPQDERAPRTTTDAVGAGRVRLAKAY